MQAPDRYSHDLIQFSDTFENNAVFVSCFAYLSESRILLKIIISVSFDTHMLPFIFPLVNTRKSIYNEAMKMISWNVNGLRACIEKGFADFLTNESPDILALQETKLQPEQVTYVPEGYHTYYFSAQKKGYSGTAVFTKREPDAVRFGIGDDRFDSEGRMITLTYPAFNFVTAYAPNAQEGLKRLDFRSEWERSVREYLGSLAQQKPVIYCGDLNVAHKEIDLKNPGLNRGNAGFSDEERAMFSELLDSGFIDTFRYRYPDATGAYSWWSYRFRAREHNAGWRIDYFLVRKSDAALVSDALIYQTVFGSDHCPVGLIWEGSWN